MSLIFLIPGILSLFLVMRGNIRTAFLSVYLPCLLLLPVEYGVRLPHLPPFSAAEFALIPLGVVGLSRLIRSSSFAFMDLLVLLYTASVSLSEVLHEPVLNNGIFAAASFFVSLGLAYVVGRQLIEPDLRFEAARRIVILVLLLGPTNLYEWRMGQNLYGILGGKLFGVDIQYGGGTQQRNGHGRIASTFSGSETAGIAFAMTFCLNAWLAFLRKVKARVDLGKTLRKLEKHHLAGLLLLFYVFGTQSRGPEIALGAGFLILQITRFRRTKVVMIVVAIVLVAGYFGSKTYFDSYTNAASPAVEQQSSALYRKLMNKEYAPIAEAGGWTGYSVTGIPHVDGMNSIDNHYLLVHLAWGRLAYYLFILIAIDNVRVLVVRCWQCKSLEDRAFMISMLAAMAVLWITLMTVFLGAQLPQLAFLLLGWTQAMAKQRHLIIAHPEVEPALGRFAFRKVFT